MKPFNRAGWLVIASVALVVGCARTPRHIGYFTDGSPPKCSRDPSLLDIVFSSSGARPVLDRDADILRYYPDRANRMRASGSARMRCSVEHERVLQCRVASETPEDQQFGEQSLKMAKWLKFPSLIDPTTVDVEVRFKFIRPGAEHCS
jgi:hypothetical protein